MNAFISLGIGAAALNDQAPLAPSLYCVTRFSETRGQGLAFAIHRLIKSTNSSVITARVLSTRLANRRAVLVACIKSRCHNQAFSPFRSALSSIASRITGFSADSAVERRRHEVRAHTITRRPFDTRKRQVDVLADLVCRLIVEFSPKHTHQVHVLELDRLGLVYCIPRKFDRISPFLPRCDEWAISDHARQIRQRSTDDVVYPFRISKHCCEDDRFSSGDLRDIRLQAEKHRRTRCRSRAQVLPHVIGTTGIPRRLRFSRTCRDSIAARIGAFGHVPRHRGPSHQGRHRSRSGLIVTPASKDARKKQELPARAHSPSLPRDADACNTGSKW